MTGKSAGDDGRRLP